MTTEDEPTTLDEIQAALAEYDVTRWEHPPGLETIRHNLLHVYITAGQIAAACEAAEDGRMPLVEIQQKLVVDILIYAARFANDGEGFSLTTAFSERLTELREKYPASIPPNV